MLVLSEPVSGLVPDFLRGDHNAVLGWAARNTAKPGRTGPESWVLQAGSQWSAEMLEAPNQQIESALIEAFRARLGMDLPEVVETTSHRWRFARPGTHGSGPLWDGERGLGVCGDWLSAPTVEGAWVSGYELGNEILSGSSVR
jgi:predicted NAD/FAD-dependent oxidoreductase